MGKGSSRRKEDLNKILKNWDLIDWGKKSNGQPVDEITPLTGTLLEIWDEKPDKEIVE